MTDTDQETMLALQRRTIKRFREKRDETKTEHIPAMTDDAFLNSLLDTLEAVQEGHYNDE